MQNAGHWRVSEAVGGDAHPGGTQPQRRCCLADGEHRQPFVGGVAYFGYAGNRHASAIVSAHHCKACYAALHGIVLAYALKSLEQHGVEMVRKELKTSFFGVAGALTFIFLLGGVEHISHRTFHTSGVVSLLNIYVATVVE